MLSKGSSETRFFAFPNNVLVIYGFPLILYTLIAVISSFFFYAPALYSDDWFLIIERSVFGGSWIDWPSTRPLGTIPFKFLIGVFGANIQLFYIILVVLNIVAGFLFYLIVLKYLPQKPITALMTGAIFLIYPAIYTRMWLTFINYFVLECLVFLYGLLLVFFIQKGRWFYLVSALLCLIFSLLSVEAALGLSLAWCWILAILERKKNWHRRLLTLICPTIVILTFAIWRTTQALQPDNIAGYTLKNPITLGTLFYDYFTGFKVLVYGWTEPIKKIFGFDKNILPLILIIILIFAVWLSFMIIMRRKGSKEENANSLMSREKQDIYPILILFLVGVILTIAGFFPVIVLFQPNLSSMLSRVNFMAIPGATLIIVAGFNAGALILRSNSRQIEILVGLASIPLVILGMVTQIWIQKETQTAWIEQKKIWSDLIALAPDLTEDTTIYFVLPGYQDRVGFVNWRRIPLQGDWDTTAALHVLYNSQKLRGDVIYPDIQTPVEPTLSQNGIIHYWEGRLTPYDRTIFVIYDGNPKRLRIIKDPVKELNLTWSIPNYSPEKRILVKPINENRYRQLVGN